MSSENRTSLILTSAVTDCAPSFIEDAAEWLWQSINPGVKCFPYPSIVRALPKGTLISGAILSTLPSTNKISQS